MSTNPSSTDTAATPHPAGTARSRLTAEQEHRLENIAASFAMEDMRPTDDELEVLAAYTLGEITAEQCDARLDALP